MKAEVESFDDSPIDDADGDRFAPLLQSAFGNVSASPEFVRSISQRLDREFELMNQSATGHSVARPHAPPQAIKWRSRFAIRVIGGFAAAAALLIGIGLWNVRPAYGWAEMIEALGRCEWVQVVSRTDSERNGSAIGWFSRSANVAAREVGEDRVFLNWRSGTAEAYNPQSHTVRKGQLGTVKEPSHHSILLLLLPSESRLSLEEFEIVSERWSTTAEDLKTLDVTLKRETTPEQYQLQFLVDANTGLPRSAKAIRNHDGLTAELNFSYPLDGPDSIYAMGVPRDSVIVDDIETIDTIISAPTEPAVAATSQTVSPVMIDAASDEALAVDEAAELPLAVVESVESVSAPAETVALKEQDQGDSHAVARIPSPAVEHSPAELGDLPAPLENSDLIREVDDILSSFWQSQGISPAEKATDSEFMRRVYLDLTGRIPTVSEVYSFLEDPREDRREHLIDDLLSRRDHATHLAAVWRTILLPEGVDFTTYGGTSEFDKWLADRFGRNLRYDEIVRQLLLAEGRVSEPGPLLFYAALKLNPEELAAKTSRAFLGTRMECAQCHDHPFDDRIGQEDFWAFAAHFAQISRPQGKMEMTSSVLRVHDSGFGEVMIPDSNITVPPRLPDSALTVHSTSEALERSRREVLADWLTSGHNDRFAQATVNRIWQLLFGRGLVEPVDDMRPDNPSTCPELLNLLARDFAASGYDLRRLIRALVLTDAYQLSSGTPNDDPSQALSFARMNMKYFTADQLYDCIAVATGIDSQGSTAADKGLSRTDNMARQRFIEQFRSAAGDRTDYQAGVPQALTLMHGSIVHGATDLKTSALLTSLNAPFFSDEQRLDTLFLATLSREPTSDERHTLLGYLAEASDSDAKLGVLGDVLWALLNSAEFTFIH